MSKRALLVGINQFKRPDVTPLRGSVRDTVEMRELLTSYFGFQEGDIEILCDSDATSQNVRKGLDWLLSDYEGDGKDVRIFLFSSHGTYVEDQDGDEWDCLDEVIVTHDHDWDKPFRDDELRKIFEPIPVGVNFTFIADCCHSGTIQKELLDSDLEFEPRFLTPPSEIIDGIERRLAARDAQAKAWARKELLKIARDTPEDEQEARTDKLLDELMKSFRQNRYAVVEAERHILLAACEDRQTAAAAKIGGEWRGVFTWALGQAMRETNGDLRYEELIQQAGSKLRRLAQRPQLECPPEMRKLKVFAPLAQT